MFGCWSSEIFWKKTEFSNSQNFCEKVQKFKFIKKFGYYSKMYVNFEKSTWSLSFWAKKPCFWVKKCRKCSEKVQKKFRKSSESSETGFSECSEISEILEIVLFQNFKKLWKNDVKLELRKSRKTRSDSKTDSKVRLKVQNAGPYQKPCCDNQKSNRNCILFHILIHVSHVYTYIFVFQFASVNISLKFHSYTTYQEMAKNHMFKLKIMNLHFLLVAVGFTFDLL